MNEELVNAMNKVLGDTFLTYFKAQAGHWNVETRSFYADHKFLGKLYEEIYGSIDTTAEWLRKIGAYAPTSLASLIAYASVTEETNVVSSMGIFVGLESSNNTVIISLMRAYKLAEEAGELGLSNYLQDRIAAHQKHAWMLKATLK